MSGPDVSRRKPREPRALTSPDINKTPRPRMPIGEWINQPSMMPDYGSSRARKPDPSRAVHYNIAPSFELARCNADVAFFKIQREESERKNVKAEKNRKAHDYVMRMDLACIRDGVNYWHKDSPAYHEVYYPGTGMLLPAYDPKSKSSDHRSFILSYEVSQML
jgi:hypothetical protein